MRSFAEIIKDTRVKYHAITQSELADKVGLNRKIITAIEGGQMPKFSHAVAIARALELDIRVLAESVHDLNAKRVKDLNGRRIAK